MSPTTDPPTIIDEAKVKAADIAQQAYNATIKQSSVLMDSASSILTTAKAKFDSLNLAVGSTSTLLGLLGTHVINVSDSMSKLGETNFSNSFVGQFQAIQKSSERALDSVGITNLLKGMGAALPAVGTGFQGLQNYALKFFATMDQRAKLGDFFLNTAASLGQLKQVYGDNNSLENFNSLVSKQQDILLAAEKGTGLTREQVTGFYQSIATIPGAMDGFITSVRKGAESTSVLQASIELARGTGNDYKTVIADMGVAYESLNLKGGEALQMTTRISEVSSKAGLQLKDVRTFTQQAATEFQYFGNTLDGQSQLLLNYSKGLEQAGLSSKQITEITKGFSSAVHSLGAAQKAYLSQQTGGPGGLQGAFQIDKMLSEGKVDQVFDKVKSTMQKQFGKILTLDDAGQSQQAAAQFEKQIQMLTQGPMGKIVQSREQAFKVLQGFKANESIKKEDYQLGNVDAVSKEQRKRGTELLDMQNTPMSIARANISAAQVSIEGTNFALGGRALAAKQGERISDVEGSVAIDEKNKALQRTMAEGSEASKKSIDKKTADGRASEAVSGLADIPGLLMGGFSGMGDRIVGLLAPRAGGPVEPKIADMKKEMEEERAKKEEERKKEIADAMKAKAPQDTAAEARRVATAQTKKKPDQQAPDQIAHRHMRDGKPEVVQLEINAYCASCHAKIHVPQTRSSSNSTSVHKQVGNNYG